MLERLDVGQGECIKVRVPKELFEAGEA